MDAALALVLDDVGLVVVPVRELSPGVLVDVRDGALVDPGRLVVVEGLPELAPA